MAPASLSSLISSFDQRKRIKSSSCDHPHDHDNHVPITNYHPPSIGNLQPPSPPPLAENYMIFNNNGFAGTSSSSSSSMCCCPCAHCHCECHQYHYPTMEEFAPNYNLLDNIPVGYRFNPTDLELVKYYLMNKINNQHLPLNKICEANIYEAHPKDLVVNYPEAIENGWYFFTPRSRKYAGGRRPDRQAGSGYWKATGGDKHIIENNVKIAGRKALVYYEGRSPGGTKTKWMMYEYVLEGYQRQRLNSTDMKLDDYVLCKIYINERVKEEVAVSTSDNDHQPLLLITNNVEDENLPSDLADDFLGEADYGLLFDDSIWNEARQAEE